MNREQKRAKAKELRKKYNLTTAQAKHVVEYNYGKNTITEGTKVKLNVPVIKANPSWFRLNPKYKQFVEDNKDTIFTVEYDRDANGNVVGNQALVCLKEDTTKPKWKFYFRDLLIQTDLEPEVIPEVSVQWNEDAEKKMTIAEREIFEQEVKQKWNQQMNE